MTVSRLLLTPESLYCDVRADISGNPAYLVDTERGEVRTARGAKDVPDPTHFG